MHKNPFTPAFGTVPAVVAGRESIIENMAIAFEEGPGNPNLSTILIGARGTGKTVCMSCIADVAAGQGWLTVRTSARDGMLTDILEQTEKAATELVDTPSAKLTAVGIGPVSAEWSSPERQQKTWRASMEDILDKLGARGTGLLITVDEVRSKVPEMLELAAVFQLFVVERRKVALVMAGLPYYVHQLVSEESVSFLRRSMQYQLARIPDSEVRRALRLTFEEAGKHIEDDALEICVEAVNGFAYALQLVGYRTWMEASAKTVTVTDAQRGVRAAQEDMETHIYAATYRDLSDNDVLFLEAMLSDTGESRLKDIAARMGVKSNYASKYKARLLAQGIIGERSRSNIIGFDTPGFRDYIARKRDERAAM